MYNCISFTKIYMNRFQWPFFSFSSHIDIVFEFQLQHTNFYTNLFIIGRTDGTDGTDANLWFKDSNFTTLDIFSQEFDTLDIEFGSSK